MNIRTFQPGDEVVQASLFNVAADALPGFKPATADEVKHRAAARGFNPAARFFAEEAGQAVGYCTLEPDQGRISFPWCKKGFEAAAPRLLDAAIQTAKSLGLRSLFAAYRRDWEPVQRFLIEQGFAVAREMINYWCDPLDMPTMVNRGKLPINRLKREDLPALAAMGKGIIRLPAEKLEAYLFSNPYFASEALLALRDRTRQPLAVAIGLESPTYADVKKIDPLAPCFRLGAFGTEGLNVKRVNGLFSYLVADPANALTAGLALLTEINQEMTEGTVTAWPRSARRTRRTSSAFTCVTSKNRAASRCWNERSTDHLRRPESSFGLILIAVLSFQSHFCFRTHSFA